MGEEEGIRRERGEKGGRKKEGERE